MGAEQLEVSLSQRPERGAGGGDDADGRADVDAVRGVPWTHDEYSTPHVRFSDSLFGIARSRATELKIASEYDRVNWGYISPFKTYVVTLIYRSLYTRVTVSGASDCHVIIRSRHSVRGSPWVVRWRVGAARVCFSPCTSGPLITVPLCYVPTACLVLIHLLRLPLALLYALGVEVSFPTNAAVCASIHVRIGLDDSTVACLGAALVAAFVDA